MPVAPPLSATAGATLIEDRYLAATRLRLRRTTDLDSGAVRHKLGQKVRPSPADPGLVLHTTMYLTREEHALLSRLPGADVRKVRHRVAHRGRRFAVDVFEGRHAGLVLVEVEVAGESGAVEAPPFAGVEVTGDERYTGGWLAFASDEARPPL